MPFDREGNWTEPTREDVAEWVENLIHPAESAPVLAEPTIQSRREEALSFYERVSSLSGSHFISIVIPVYNGLHLLKPCLKAIEQHTTVPYELILVDDCSTDREILTFITEEAISKYKNVQYVTHDVNKGFAASCNSGFKASQGEHVCILNTDVLVTPYWAEKLLMALGEKSAVIANPMTNNTAMLGFPMLPGQSYLDMNKLLEHNWNPMYPTIMPTGFCMMFERHLLDKVGPFDEAFVSYGEESDWWMRTIQHYNKETGEFPRYKAVLADDCYVFHQRSGSFSQLGEAQHSAYRQHGAARFHKLHPEFKTWMEVNDVKNILPSKFHTFPNVYKYSLCYVVRSAEHCGAMDFIADIVNELIEQNVDAKVVVIKRYPQQRETWTEELHTSPIFFQSEEEFLALFTQKVFNAGSVVAGSGEVLPIVMQLTDAHEHLEPILHAQSWEPDLALTDEEKKEAKLFYDRLPRKRISCSTLLSEKLAVDFEDLENNIFVIEPGVRQDIFHKRRNRKSAEKTILVSLNDQYWFKGLQYAIPILHEWVKDYRVIAYGIDSLPEVPGVICLGRLTQEQIADLLQDCDYFVDPSVVHSYGLPEEEADYCGVKHCSFERLSAKQIDNPTFAAKSLIDYMYNCGKSFAPTRQNAVKDMVTLYDHWFGQGYQDMINVVTPHLRKHGGPTTIANLANVLSHLGHQVNLISCYDDFRFNILEYIHPEVKLFFGIDKAPKANSLIVNSDNPFIEQLNPDSYLRKYLLKLSHNERFKEFEEKSLQRDWTRILCSTKFLRDQCKIPSKDWNYSAVKCIINQIGWYHYDHPIFDCPPDSREYASNGKFRITTLLHNHELKGSKIAIAAMYGLRKKYGDQLTFQAVGETPISSKPDWLHYYESLSRKELASVLQATDIWLGASYTEGLGRMALEAMSAGAAVVHSDIGCEYMEDEKNCLLYPAGNAQKAAESVDRVIQSGSVLDGLSREGYITASEKADPMWYVQSLQEIFGKSPNPCVNIGRRG